MFYSFKLLLVQNCCRWRILPFVFSQFILYFWFYILNVLDLTYNKLLITAQLSWWVVFAGNFLSGALKKKAKMFWRKRPLPDNLFFLTNNCFLFYKVNVNFEEKSCYFKGFSSSVRNWALLSQANHFFMKHWCILVKTCFPPCHAFYIIIIMKRAIA